MKIVRVILFRETQVKYLNGIFMNKTSAHNGRGIEKDKHMHFFRGILLKINIVCPRERVCMRRRVERDKTDSIATFIFSMQSWLSPHSHVGRGSLVLHDYILLSTLREIHLSSLFFSLSLFFSSLFLLQVSSEKRSHCAICMCSVHVALMMICSRRRCRSLAATEEEKNV